MINNKFKKIIILIKIIFKLFHFSYQEIILKENNHKLINNNNNISIHKLMDLDKNWRKNLKVYQIFI